ncbi:MAG: hypothetical protein KJZ52_11240, partial [Anaerolineales bacterium]|nr:hypothetical protein [Anaerolineales bacterium]
MKRTFSFIFLTIFLLASCSPSDAPTQIISATDQAIQPTGLPASPAQAIAASPTTPAATATPKPPLEKDAWMQMPVVPAGVSESMREVYQRGIESGNDPTHFSIIGDCQNVSSYFLSVFDTPGEFSLGSEYAYLQPTIDYYHGSYSRVSLAVKGGFNAAAVLSPLRADPKSCNANESPLDCELRTWRPSIVFVSMETWWSHKPAEEY